ncbi:MAG: ribosomal small subunit Rsm22 [uncultured bacterium]|nr:MAG: ribosomal small subunit Rsm22 [uncultured bacterium]
MPLNFLKIVQILNQYQPKEILSGHVRVLDLGCGPGTSSLGLTHFYDQMITQKKIGPCDLDITLIDQNYHAIREARNLFEVLKQSTLNKNTTVNVSSRSVDFRKMPISKLLGNFKYHYILLSNVLNEIGDRQAKIQFVSQLMKHLDPQNGRLILIEPALKNTSRDLQSVRDEIAVISKEGYVQLPCLNQNMCPLNIVNKRDWCHFYGAWEPPVFIKKLDKLIGNKNDWLKFSYIVLSPQPREWQRVLPKFEDSWRVISNQMPTNGKKEIVFCGPKGRYHLERLDKDKSAQNRMFDAMRRGDIVEWCGADKSYANDGRVRFSKEDVLAIW